VCTGTVRGFRNVRFRSMAGNCGPRGRHLTIARTSAKFPESRPFPAAILAPPKAGLSGCHSERSRKHDLDARQGPCR